MAHTVAAGVLRSHASEAATAAAAAKAAKADAQAARRTHLRSLRVADLQPADLAAWHDLEAHALEPNAYLSPLFLVPALRHLDPDGRVQLLLLESVDTAGGQPRLDALVPLEPHAADRALPLPHRRADQTLHAYLHGVMVRRTQARQHLTALHAAWARHAPHGVVFPTCRIDGPTDRLLAEVAAARGLRRVELDGFERAVMEPRTLGDADLNARLPSRAKKLRSQRNKLAKHGELRFTLHHGAAIDTAVVERHLALEHMGWKGENGSSLRSHAHHEAFFGEMVRGFAGAGRAFFAELSVGGQVIASSSNLIAGGCAFAFKIGFDPAYSAGSPGIVCELELMRCAPDELGHLERMDSGSVAGSYLEELWPLRERMATVAYASTRVGSLALLAADRLRQWKRQRQAAKATGSPAGSTPAAPDAP